MNGFGSFAKPNRLPALTARSSPAIPKRDAQAIRSKEGIPLLKPMVDDLYYISKKIGIPFDTSRST
jgi:L-2-hydroxycarboxylate dehydrogenase (NAD+)